MKITTVFLILFFLGATAFADQSVVFSGRPSVKISEGGTNRTPEQISKSVAHTLECVISQDGESYYWASRGDVPMVRVDAGAFTTFVAVNGSGYVRVVVPAMKDAARLMSETEGRFDYVEHMNIGLRSITYYGVDNL